MALRFWLLLFSSGPLLRPAPPPPGPTLSGCPVFPADHIWNASVRSLPAHPRSAGYVRSIGAALPLHPDFGPGRWRGALAGIPFVVVPASQPMAPVVISAAQESDAGPAPIPAGIPIEGDPRTDADRHALILQQGSCKLYELYRLFPGPAGSWRAEVSVRWDLRSYALRPRGWTSADAAGLPILPGLVRYEEVAAGRIAHALRFTAPRTGNSWTWPARHRASLLTDPDLPPMGQRFRLRSSFDTAPFAAQSRVILEALKEYGMMLADHGGAWFLSGAPDQRWDSAALEQLKRLRGSDFEAVDAGILRQAEDSGKVRLPATASSPGKSRSASKAVVKRSGS